MTKTNDALREQIQTKLYGITVNAYNSSQDALVGVATEYTDSIMQLILQDRKRLIERLETEAVGDDRPYEKYEPCPVCGSQYQYKCSCDEADSVVRNEIRQRFDTIKQEELEGGGE